MSRAGVAASTRASFDHRLAELDGLAAGIDPLQGRGSNLTACRRRGAFGTHGPGRSDTWMMVRLTPPG